MKVGAGWGTCFFFLSNKLLRGNMSGGSYNYLCGALDLEDLLSKRHHLEEMADRLEGLSEIEFPGAGAAGRMTRELLLKIRLWESHAAISAALLSDVWKSVEWWDSSDWGPDAVRDGLEKLLQGDK
jgi:hypothetical protein